MPQLSDQQAVLDLLGNLRGLDPLKELFWSRLNYDRVNQPLSRRNWTETASLALADDPLLFASGGEDNDFHIIYARLNSDRLLLGTERPVVSRLLQDHPYALIIFSNAAQDRWHFLNVKYDEQVERRRLFRRITVGPEERLRTASERIALLDLGERTLGPLEIQSLHDEAFDVEKVTSKFFEAYHDIFNRAEAKIKGLGNGVASNGVASNERRLFTQRLFNRLLFIIFLERKGWLTLNGRRDYLQALWDAHQKEKAKGEAANFYDERLKLLFFAALNTPNEVNIVGIRRDGFLQSRIGQAPYLNGGLFEEDEFDRDPAVHVPDDALAPAVRDLLYHFNFTVTESTPLDVEVAVDPEMLGKIFEELVTGRHETGSYYTPKPVVSFMCREALKGYLQTACPRESPDGVGAFVDNHDPTRLKNAESVLYALRTVRACDPACGSGAYLVGLLHELLDLRAALFVTRGLDSVTTYQRKLDIIQTNLYGVDLDPFAVNIARLRLWLSLGVDFEGDDPPPLPNLDFKIEVGDSLTAPDPSGGLQPDLFRQQKIQEYFALKADYLMAHGGEKLTLRARIEQLRGEIAAWTHPPLSKTGEGRGGGGFDWAVEFAEVFSPSPDSWEKGPGDEGIGFDVVLANPPYVRQELLGREHKENALKPVYPEVYSGMADLYVYFYARAHQLLRPGGAGCFISSNKWLRAGYGEKLRQHLLDSQVFRFVVDFGDQPVFQAATAYPCIFMWQKQPRGDTPTMWAVVKDLQACYDEGLLEHVTRIAQTIPASQFGKGKSRLAISTTSDRRAKMDSSGLRLGEIVKGQIYRGIITGLNEAYIVDRATRDYLVAEDPNSAKITKPILTGDHVRRYELHYHDTFLVWTYIGVPIRQYPAVFKHLKRFQVQAEQRWDQGEHWWELRACDFYHVFDHPKIMYPEMRVGGVLTHYADRGALVLKNVMSQMTHYVFDAGPGTLPTQSVLHRRCLSRCKKRRLIRT